MSRASEDVNITVVQSVLQSYVSLMQHIIYCIYTYTNFNPVMDDVLDARISTDEVYDKTNKVC